MTRPFHLLCLRAAIGLAAMSAVYGSAWAQTSYTVSDVGNLPGGVNRMFPTALNNRGQAVGYSAKESYTWHGWITPPMAEIGTFGGQASFANAVNDSGVVVGQASTSSWATRAFMLSGGKLTDFTKTNGTVARGINNLPIPQIVGSMPLSKSQGGTQGFSWQNGKLVALKLLAGGDVSRAAAVNDSGAIVGESNNGPGTGTQPVYWSSAASAPVSLGLSGGSAKWINSAGQIVGDCSLGSFLWQSGTVTILPLLPGENRSAAVCINAAGVIVGGQSYEENGAVFNGKAVRWTNGLAVDLQTLIPTGSGILLSGAIAINNSGQILCSGNYVDPLTGQVDYHERAFLLTPQ